jgi:hypothetical protein
MTGDFDDPVAAVRETEMKYRVAAGTASIPDELAAIAIERETGQDRLQIGRQGAEKSGRVFGHRLSSYRWGIFSGDANPVKGLRKVGSIKIERSFWKISAASCRCAESTCLLFAGRFAGTHAYAGCSEKVSTPCFSSEKAAARQWS